LKVKGGAIQKLRSVTCRMGLPATRQRWTRSALTPAI